MNDSISQFTVTTLEADLKDSKALENLKNQITALETENEQLIAEAERLKADISELSSSSGKVVKLAAELKAKSFMVNSLRSSLTDTEARLGSGNALIEALTSKVRALSEQLAAARLESDLRQPYSPKEGSTTTGSPRDESQQPQTEKIPVGRMKEFEPVVEHVLDDARVEALLRESEDLKDKHLKQLEAIKTAYARNIRDTQRSAREKLEKQRDDGLKRAATYQALIGRLEDKIREYEAVYPEISKAKGSEGVREAITPLPACQFSVVLPGATTSVKVPIQRLQQDHDALIIHVVLPPQRLSIFHDDGVFTLEKTDVQRFHQSLVADMTVNWK